MIKANGIYLGDCLELLRTMPDKSVDLVFTSPPYEAARTYGIAFKLKGQEWVDWCVERFMECLRVCRGLVAWNVEGQTRKYQWSAVPMLLAADLHRRGVNLRKPPIFHRVGVSGSGGKRSQHEANGGSADWLRNDYEFIICATHGGKLPWADTLALGHAPKWAPGGEMSNRLTDGTRVNQWGHSADSGATVVLEGGVIRQKGKRPSHVEQRNQWGGTKKNGNHRKSSGEGTEWYERPSHRFGKMADAIAEDGAEPKVAAALANGIPPGGKLHTKNNGSKMRVQCNTAPAVANPGNVLKYNVGGGVMGSRLCHDNEAPFPEGLAEFFVRSFCPEGGIVLDPFCGSGTTLAVADKWGRKYIGMDIRQSQVELSRRRVAEVEKPLFKE